MDSVDSADARQCNCKEIATIDGDDCYGNLVSLLEFSDATLGASVVRQCAINEDCFKRNLIAKLKAGDPMAFEVATSLGQWDLFFEEELMGEGVDLQELSGVRSGSQFLLQEANNKNHVSSLVCQSSEEFQRLVPQCPALQFLTLTPSKDDHGDHHHPHSEQVQVVDSRTKIFPALTYLKLLFSKPEKILNRLVSDIPGETKAYQESEDNDNDECASSLWQSVSINFLQPATSLRTLRLEHLTTIHLSLVCEYLSNISSPQCLDALSCSFTLPSGEDGSFTCAETYFESLGSFVDVLGSTSLNYLTLCGLLFDGSSSTALVESLKRCNIRTISLPQTRFVPNGDIEFANPLWRLLQRPSIAVANFEDCKCSTTDCASLAEALVGSSVAHLNLANNRVSGPGFATLCQQLPTAHVRSFSLESNALCVNDITALAEGVKLSSIENLNLARCNITDDCCEILYNALPQTRLIFLNLRCNQIGDDAGQRLAETLPESQIVVLNLAENSLGPGTGTILAKTLPLTSVCTLDVSSNRIGSEAVQELLQALPRALVDELEDY